MRPDDQFHDYTLASKLERFAAAVEQTLVSWQRTGFAEIIYRGYRARIKEQPSQVKVVASLQHRLPWRREPYILQLHLPTALALGPGGAIAVQLYSSPNAVQQPQPTGQQPPPPPAPPPPPPAAATGAAAATDASSPTAAAAAVASLSCDSVPPLPSSDPAPSPGPGPCQTGSDEGAAPVDGAEGGMPLHVPADSGGGGGGVVAGDANGGGDDARGVGDGGAAVGVAASEADLSWEVGVDLDLTELLSRIDTIVNDAEARDPGGLDPGGSGRTGQNGRVNSDSDSDLGRASQPGGGDNGFGTAPLTAGGKPDEQQQPQEQQERHGLGQVAGPAGGGSNAGKGILPTHGSAGTSSTAAAASAHLAAVWSSGGRPAGLPWWLPTFQHRLQRWFGLDAFLLLHPASFSRRILDETEAGSLLSAAASALASCGLRCPLLLPVHDGLRDAYWGVAVVPELGCLHLRTDSVHISSPPKALTQLPAQLQALGEQLMPYSPPAAAACLLAVQANDDDAQDVVAVEGQDTPEASGGGDGGDMYDRFRITWSACFTFRVPLPSRRLRVRLERWGAAAAAAAAAGNRDAAGAWLTAATTSGDAIDGGSAAAAPATQLPAVLPSSTVGGRRSHPLDTWHHMLTTTEAVASSSSSSSSNEAGGGGGGGNDASPSPSSSPPQVFDRGVLGTDGGGGGGGGGGIRVYDTDDDVDGVCEEGAPGGAGKHGTSGPEDDEDGDDLYGGEFPNGGPWDAQAPWHPWAVQSDPVAALELDVAWEDLPVPLQPQPPPLGAPQPQQQQQHRFLPHLQVASAQRWLLHALQVDSGGGGGGGVLSRMGRMGSMEAPRRHVELQRAGADWLWNAAAAESWRQPGGQPPPSVTPVPSTSQVGPGSFTVMLSSLLTSRTLAVEAMELGDLLDPDWWEARGWEVPPLPPPHVMQDVLQDLFNHTVPRPAAAATELDAGDNLSPYSVPYQRTAPFQGLLSRLALHALLFGNARSVAWLWQRFVRELRFACWEEERPLPRMRSTSTTTADTTNATSATTTTTATTAIPSATAQTADTLPPPLPPSPRPPLHSRAKRPESAAAQRTKWGAAATIGGVAASPFRRLPGNQQDDGDDDGDGDDLDHGSEGAASDSGSDDDGDGEGDALPCDRTADLERLLLRLQAEDPPPQGPDLRHCLLHQKLQVLDVCIHRRRMLAKQQHLVRHMEQQWQQTQLQRQQPQKQPQQQQQQQQQQEKTRPGPGSSAAATTPTAEVTAGGWEWECEWPAERGVEGQGRGEGAEGCWWTELSDGWTVDNNDVRCAAAANRRTPSLGDAGELLAPAAASAAAATTTTIINTTGRSSPCGGDAGGGRAGGGGDSGGGDSTRRFACSRLWSPPQSGLVTVPSVADTEAYYSAGDEQPDEQTVTPPPPPTLQQLPAGPGLGGGGSRRQAQTPSPRPRHHHHHHHHHQRTLRRRRVPVRAPALTQLSPVLSEDRMAERQEALEGLAAHPQGVELTWRMNSEQLASDMAAFKAANSEQGEVGCSFSDFIAWHSPRDVVMTLEGSPSSGPTTATATATARKSGWRKHSGGAREGGNRCGSAIPWPEQRGRYGDSAAVDGRTAEEEAAATAAATAAGAVEGGEDPGGGTAWEEGQVQPAAEMAAADRRRWQRRQRSRHSGGGGGADGGVVLSARMGSSAVSGGFVTGIVAIAAGSVASAAAAADTPAVAPPRNPWRVLWESTAACPVWEQKLLQDPGLEGERVLHELETISPEHLYDTLLATALATAVQLLASSDGGSLPPVASLLRQYVRISAPILRRGCSLVAASSIASASPSVVLPRNKDGRDGRPVGPRQPEHGPKQQSHHHSVTALMGWEDAELEYLLAEFHYLEQAVVLGESLVRRLPGNKALAADLMTSTLHGSSSLEEGRTVLRPAAWAKSLLARQALAALLAGRCPPPQSPPSSAQRTLRQQQQLRAQRQGRQQLLQGDVDSGDGGSSSGRRLEPRAADEARQGAWEAARCEAEWQGASETVEGRHSDGCGVRARGRRPGARSSGRNHGRAGDSAGNIVFNMAHWQAPCRREWLLRVEQSLGPGALQQQRCISTAASATGDAVAATASGATCEDTADNLSSSPPPGLGVLYEGDKSCTQRLYVLAAEDELRVATAIWHTL